MKIRFETTIIMTPPDLHSEKDDESLTVDQLAKTMNRYFDPTNYYSSARLTQSSLRLQGSFLPNQAKKLAEALEKIRHTSALRINLNDFYICKKISDIADHTLHHPLFGPTAYTSVTPSPNMEYDNDAYIYFFKLLEKNTLIQSITLDKTNHQFILATFDQSNNKNAFNLEKFILKWLRSKKNLRK